MRSNAKLLGSVNISFVYLFFIPYSFGVTPSPKLIQNPDIKNLPSLNFNLKRTPSSLSSTLNESISLAEIQKRENEYVQEVIHGNIPESLKRLVAIKTTLPGTTIQGRFFVTPDYLSIGSDKESFYISLRPVSAQAIANALKALLPTKKMIDFIYDHAKASGKVLPARPLSPQMSTPDGGRLTGTRILEHMASQRWFNVSQQLIELDKNKMGVLPGELLEGHKKNLVLSGKLYDSSDRYLKKLAIYGFYQSNGLPIQGSKSAVYPSLPHDDQWVDYSHGVRLVSQTMHISKDGGYTYFEMPVRDVLSDPELYHLLTDEPRGIKTIKIHPTTEGE